MTNDDNLMKMYVVTQSLNEDDWYDGGTPIAIFEYAEDAYRYAATQPKLTEVDVVPVEPEHG